MRIEDGKREDPKSAFLEASQYYVQDIISQCDIDVTKKVKPVETDPQITVEVKDLNDEFEVIKRGFDLVKKIKG